ncbi:MAG: anthranilate phosphoribosyltransferase [Nitrospira sp.]|nr:anthranilate phosphoribosyltransferase [Nitrospira sp.]MDH4369263.1 anthranilate phosphoribosyltransferase [Nitrospira sp.]MDH5346590.1 anthranilate phosphoribosyltransferase [Nitrospira sp.]MDH5496009.1 anthranilate phosphoribosyltransferase [Nitrospira sp.]MDH5724093.1 anthranilate phosphoribosyltransferase [Nitrospira sp.]
MIKNALAKLADRTDLTAQEAETVMLEIMDGAVTSAQIAAYLMGLRQKEETVAEIVGSVNAMRSRATKIRVGSSVVVDTCGTGGDGANTFNISTAAAFVVAGAGITVAKHGNRSVSSRSGSADVLSALRVKIDLEPGRVADCIDEVGIGFLFAPLYHGAMKQCAGVRQEMGIRTILNVLGPLANPAGATHQVLGVYDARWTDILGRVLLELGSQHCFVIHGMDGLDEITLSDRTRLSEGKSGVVSSYFIAPEEFDLARVPNKEVAGGTPEDNAQILQDILQGRKGPKRDIVCLNAAPAMVVGQKARTLKEGFRLAQQMLDTGAAAEKLERLIAFTTQRG